MDHLDAATLTEFQDFNKIYIPNNAVLVVAGL
jgi:predicted Zn-dependent peptidase